MLLLIVIDCGRPSVNMNVDTTYNSTSLGALLALTCIGDLLPSGTSLAQCSINESWIPNPIDFTCRSTSDQESGTIH